METQRKIDFHYLKPPDYRTFHADGVIGGVTPSGGLSISFYVERLPIPQTITNTVAVDGKLMEEASRTTKNGVIRELDCGIILTYEASKALQDWLSTNIQLLEAKLEQKKKKKNESN